MNIIDKKQEGPENKHIKCHIESYSLWIIIFCTAINVFNTALVKSTYNKLTDLADIIGTELTFLIGNEQDYHLRVDELIQSTLDLNESVHQFVELAFDYLPAGK